MKQQARYSMKKGQLVDNYAPAKQLVAKKVSKKKVGEKIADKPDYAANAIIIGIVVISIVAILALRTNVFGLYN